MQAEKKICKHNNYCLQHITQTLSGRNLWCPHINKYFLKFEILNLILLILLILFKNWCLRIKNDTETSGFKESCTDAYLSYEQINFKNGNIDFRPVIKCKRNDSRVNRHQRLQLQSWWANCNFQLIIAIMLV